MPILLSCTKDGNIRAHYPRQGFNNSVEIMLHIKNTAAGNRTAAVFLLLVQQFSIYMPGPAELP